MEVEAVDKVDMAMAMEMGTDGMDIGEKTDITSTTITAMVPLKGSIRGTMVCRVKETIIANHLVDLEVPQVVLAVHMVMETVTEINHRHPRLWLEDGVMARRHHQQHPHHRNQTLQGTYLSLPTTKWPSSRAGTWVRKTRTRSRESRKSQMQRTR
jgi:hypothetical protein